METLNYLDDSPVFPKDRRLAIAFVAGGGIEAERAMREQASQEPLIFLGSACTCT